MKCDRIRRLISDGFERRLTIEERLEIRDHIQSCAACAAFDRNLHSGIAAIQRLPDITPSPKLWESVHALNALQPRATPKRVAHQALGIAGAALTVALLALVTILLFNNHTATPANSPTGQAAFAPVSTATAAKKSVSPTTLNSRLVPIATPIVTPEATTAGAGTSTPAATPPATAASSATPATVYTTPVPPVLDDKTAQDTVVAYFHAINMHDYAMAYAYLGSDMQQQQTYDSFASGYSDTARDTVTINDIAASQPNELAVSLRLDALQSDGSTLHYDGTYVVGIEENVPKIVDANVAKIDNGTPVASPAADSTTCLAKKLKATASYQGATGSMAGSIIFTYNGSGTCTLAGIPEIQIVDASGQPLKVKQVSTSLGANEKPIVLESGQQAALRFTWSNWCPAVTSETPTATTDKPGLSFRITLSETAGVVTAPAIQEDGTPITAVPRCDAAQHDSTLSVRGFSSYPDS